MDSTRISQTSTNSNFNKIDASNTEGQLNNTYISVLEKTNQQLSLWYNPYGVMVGALGVLFAILAIVATIMIYRQGKEYKEKLEEDRKEFKNRLSEFLRTQEDIIREKSEEAKKIDIKINELLSKYQQQLKSASNEQKKEIQKAIDQLQKMELQNSLGTVGYVGSPLTTFGNTSWKKYKCSNCNLEFFNPENGSTLSSAYWTGNVFSSLNRIVCPRCNFTVAEVEQST